MNTRFHNLAAAGFLLFGLNASASVLYVDLNSPNPAPPYTNWVTAATNIQDAVDAATDGDTVLVTNGVYATGGRVYYGGEWGIVVLTNRVVIDRPLTVQSVNGPQVTLIQGAARGTRCVAILTNAVFVGFTIANGTADQSGGHVGFEGGGVWCKAQNTLISNCVFSGNVALLGGAAYGGTMIECTFSSNAVASDSSPFVTIGGGAVASNVLYNCTLTGNTAAAEGGAAYGSTLSNCLLVGNSAVSSGGAAYGGNLINCTVCSNSAANGGGVAYATSSNCTLVGNNVSLCGGASYYSTLLSCQLFGNAIRYDGGGAYGGSLNNCVVCSNAARYGGGIANATCSECTLVGNAAISGGAAYGSTLSRCQLAGNSAVDDGGGACDSTLSSCLLVGNSASSAGGGAYGGTLADCIVCSNSAPGFYMGGGAYSVTANNCVFVGNDPDGADLSTVTNSILRANKSVPFELRTSCGFCCFEGADDPLPGNFDLDPAFVDMAAGDFHLRSNSPCINAGSNRYVSTTNDFDGNPRIAGDTVDVGAYEYELPASVLSYAWAQKFGLPTDGSADLIDPDGDGMNNWQEWIAGTNPTNAASALAMLPLVTTASNTVVAWQGVNRTTYFLQRSTDLSAQPAFVTIQSNIAGQAPVTTFLNITATNSGPYFYRIGVQW